MKESSTELVARGEYYGIVEEGLTPEDADKMIVEGVKLALSLGNKKVIGTCRRGLPLEVIMYAAAASSSMHRSGSFVRHPDGTRARGAIESQLKASAFCIMWKSKKCL